MLDPEDGMTPRTQTHRVYMSFMDRQGWQRQFLEAGLQTPLPKRLHFASSNKVVDLVERAGGFTDQESRLMLEQGISMGRGGVLPSKFDPSRRQPLSLPDSDSDLR